MKTVRLNDHVVHEIIPDYALPVEKWYGDTFAKQCVEAPDNVEPGMVYDPIKNVFSWPTPEVNESVLLKEKIEALSSQQSFLEDCIAEMAQIVYE